MRLGFYTGYPAGDEPARADRARAARGEHYHIPYTGPGSTSLAKSRKLMTRPLRAEIPIYLASISPKSVELTFEIADGWLPIFFVPEKARAASRSTARATASTSPRARPWS